MKFAFTTRGTTWEAMMDPRFGRAAYLLVYDDVTDKLSPFDNRPVAAEAHGAGPRTAQKLYDIKPDILITGNGPGGNAAIILAKLGLPVYVGAGEMSVKEAFKAYKKGILKQMDL